MQGMQMPVNHAPDFLGRFSIDAADLLRLDEPAVIFEHHGHDDDGASFFVYTVAGFLDGRNIFSEQEQGCTVGGDVIVIHADKRDDADEMAAQGLFTTILSMEAEEKNRLDALAAQARLASISPMERLEQAMRDDKNPDFVEDVSKIRTLVGDDIILAGGH